MKRRSFILGTTGALSGAALTLGSSAALAEAAVAGQGEPASAPRLPANLESLVSAFQTCGSAADHCISFCQEAVKNGDSALVDCLATAQDCAVACRSVVELGQLHSRQVARFIRASVPVMNACVKACTPHVDHHSQCRDCVAACRAALKESSRAL